MAQLDLFDLYAKISIDLSEFEHGINQAQSKFKDFSSNIKSLSDGLSKSYSGIKDVLKPAVDGFKAVETVGKTAGKGVSNALKMFGTAATAVGGFGATAINAGMSFDATMSEVSAISGATGEDFDGLRDKALEMGAKTKFSATEAAEAMTYMGMAGWKAGDMISGIEGIMNLAAASGEDLASVSDIVTDALSAFGMQAGESGHFADILAVASSNSNTNVGMMGETFKYVAPVMGALGYTAEDAALAIGIMANSGIKATQAGTTLRSIMTRLATDAGGSSKSLGALGILTEKLGVAFYDADGSARPLTWVLEDMREAWKGLTVEEQNNYAKKIAGQEAISGFLALMNAEEDTWWDLSVAIENCGNAAEDMSKVRLDNLQGDITLLKSAFESLQIAISDSLTPTLREFAQFGQKAMAGLLEGFQGGGVSGFMSALSGIVTDGVTMLAEKAPEFASVSLQFIQALASGILGAKTEIILSANEIINTLRDGISSWLSTNSDGLITLGRNIVSTLFWGFTDAGDIISQHIGDFVPLIASAFTAYHEALFTVGLDILGAIGKGIIENKEEIQYIASGTIESMVTSLRDNAPSIIEGGLALLEALVGAIRENLPLILETGAEIIGQLVAGISTASPEVGAIIGVAVLPHIMKIIETVGQIGSTVGSVVKLVSGGISTVMGIGSKLIGGVKALFALIAAHPVVAVITAIIAAVTMLWTHCEGFRDAVKAIWDAIVGFFQAAAEAIQTAWGAIVDFFAGVWQGIQSIFAGVGEFFAGLFQGAAQAVQAAWEGVVNFFATVWQGIQNVFSTVATVLGGIFSAAWNAVQTVWNAAGAFFSGIVTAIKGAFEGIGEFLGNLFTAAWKLVEAAWSVAVDFFSTIGEGIRTAFEAVTSFLGEAFSAAWNVITGVWNGAVSFFGGIWEGIKSGAGAAADFIGGALSKAWNAVTSAWNGAMDFFGGIWDGIKNVFSNVWDVFSEIGGNIVEGIKNGVSKAWNHFWGWLKDKVGSLVGGVMSLLGIHSPSTVFAGIGENMALGLAEGWDNEFDGIKRQIESGLSFKPVPVGLVASGSGYNASRSGLERQQGAFGGAGNTYVTINSPVAVDAIQAAREWKRTTQRMAVGYV